MPLRCLLFGHRWHNDDNDGPEIVYDEPCVRTACVIVRNPAPDAPTEPDAVVRQRGQLADLIHANRFDHAGHADSFYAGMRHAEQLIRGEN